jgi:hypothetical protein
LFWFRLILSRIFYFLIVDIRILFISYIFNWNITVMQRVCIYLW